MATRYRAENLAYELVRTNTVGTYGCFQRRTHTAKSRSERRGRDAARLARIRSRPRSTKLLLALLLLYPRGVDARCGNETTAPAAAARVNADDGSDAFGGNNGRWKIAPAGTRIALRFRGSINSSDWLELPQRLHRERRGENGHGRQRAHPCGQKLSHFLPRDRRHRGGGRCSWLHDPSAGLLPNGGSWFVSTGNKVLITMTTERWDVQREGGRSSTTLSVAPGATSVRRAGFHRGWPQSGLR